MFDHLVQSEETKMALLGRGCVRSVCSRYTAGETLRALFQSGCFKCRNGARRYLLSEDVVRLQEFQQRKLAVAQQVPESKGQFFDAINQKLEKKQLILKHELRLLLLLCQSPDDIVTARNVIYRYHEENCNMAFGEFRFGPLFIRLCYELGLEDFAAATLTDKRLKGFFQDCTSFNIAIDLLFIKENFEGALNLVKEMKTQGVAFNKDTYTLAFATCYKLNTPKSYQICLGLLEEGQTMGSVIPRHAYCIAVALALHQEDVEQAQIIYSQIINTDSRLCQNLRVLLLAKARLFKDAISVLRTAMMSNSSALVKKTDFCQEVLLFCPILPPNTSSIMFNSIKSASLFFISKFSTHLLGTEELLIGLQTGQIASYIRMLSYKLGRQNINLDVLKERSLDGPWKSQVEHLVRQLQQMGLADIQSLDQLLCRTPAGKKKFLSILKEPNRRTTSRRTLRPLLSE